MSIVWLLLLVFIVIPFLVQTVKGLMKLAAIVMFIGVIYVFFKLVIGM